MLEVSFEESCWIVFRGPVGIQFRGAVLDQVLTGCVGSRVVSHLSFKGACWIKFRVVALKKQQAVQASRPKMEDPKQARATDERVSRCHALLCVVVTLKNIVPTTYNVSVK